MYELNLHNKQISLTVKYLNVSELKRNVDTPIGK